MDKFLVMPPTLELQRSGYRKTCFAPDYFKSNAGYNRLMLSREFYARFAAYEYVLIHQLDAIVFGSVEPFLGMGVDYLGAPWIEHDANGAPYLTRVGNGGLSLRRVSAFRQLLGSKVRATTPRDFYRRGYSDAPPGRRAIGLCKACLKALGIRNSIDWAIKGALGHEDWFIADEAKKYSPAFTFGTVDQALSFAFEEEPRFCCERAGGRLPFGAHAWALFDRAFWEPHLLS
jgi:hypothetical protein